ncbi:hypothetical protein BH10PSE6_BH10PSE6_11400 [soil metagenome]
MSQAGKWPARLRRKAASDYLNEVHGIRLSVATLAKLACNGGGPLFEYDGRSPVYQPANLDSFATARLGPLRRSTAGRRAP